MTRVMAATFSVEPAQNEEQLQQVLTLLSNAFESLDAEHARQKLHWLNDINPAGPAQTYLLLDNEKHRIVGSQSVCTRQYRCDGKLIAAGTLVDFTVDKAYRSLGPALQLIKGSTQQVGHSLGFTYGLPNKKAAPVVKRAGAQDAGYTHRMLRPLKTDRLLRRLPGPLAAPISSLLNGVLNAVDWLGQRGASRTLQSHWGPIPPAILDQIWQTADYPGVHVAVRNGATVQWRFCNEDDGLTTQQVLFTSRQQPAEALGYILFALHGERIKILDFFFVRPDPTLLTGCWRLFLWQIRRLQCTDIQLEFFGPQPLLRALHHIGFIDRDSAPIVVFPGTRPVPLGAENWYLTHYDRDT